jgi:hypothetical protein
MAPSILSSRLLKRSDSLCQQVKFSPITFGLAEILEPLRNDRFDVAEVLDDGISSRYW